MSVAARRMERPGWVNLRTVLGAALFSIALGSGWQVLATAERGYHVYAATSDLPEGTKLTPALLTLVEVRLPPAQMSRYLGEASALDRAVLMQPLREGELVAAAAVGESRVGGGRVITIPITADHAAGGTLRPGDRVDVFASLAAGQPDARTALLVAGAEVEDLVHSDGLVMDERSLAGVTIEVSPQEAARVAFAIRGADIDIVKVTDASSPALVGPVRRADL